MTPEQLDEIEKLAEAWQGWGHASEKWAIKLADSTLPLAKALREAWAALEWQAAMTKALSESQERLANEAKEARAACFQLESERNQAVKDRDASYDAIESARATTQRVRDVAMRKRNEAKAEVERLREVVRQVHARLDRVTIDWDSGLNQLVCDIRKITKGMVE